MILTKDSQATVSLVVNGNPVTLEVSPRKTLSEMIRDDLRLTGTHVGCGTGECGSCTVIMDGEPIRSCLCLAVQASGTSIETIEGIGGDQPENLSVVQRAFREHHALQCGFCTPGIVVAATALLRKDLAPEDSDLKNLMSGHLCRCTGYANIMKALRSAAQAKEC